EIQVGEAEQVGGPGACQHRGVRAVLNQDDRGQNDLHRADEKVEDGRAARRNDAERVQPVDEKNDANEEKADIAHAQLPNRLRNVSDEMTGAKNWLMRWTVAGSFSGRLQPVASPMTIGRRPLSRAARALPSMHQSVWIPV